MRKMTRVAVIGLALAGLIGFSSAANAADINRRDGYGYGPYGGALPIWAGLYVGGSVGYGWGDVSDDVSFPLSSCVGLCSSSDNFNGLIYGGHIGYNFQRANLVLGVEASLNGANMDGSSLGGEIKNELDWYGAGVGRLGYAQGSLLFYGFGGVAWGKVKTSAFDDSADATHVGWTVGAGIEHAYNDRFSVRLEYSHVDLGSETVTLNGFEDHEVDVSFDAVKLGASYKLSGGSGRLEPLK